MTFDHATAVRRRYPTAAWRELLESPSHKALLEIAHGAVVAEYITPRSAADIAGIPIDEAHDYLELLTDMQILSEPLPHDRQDGRAVYVDRKDWTATAARLRAIPLKTQGVAA